MAAAFHTQSEYRHNWLLQRVQKRSVLEVFRTRYRTKKKAKHHRHLDPHPEQYSKHSSYARALNTLTKPAIITFLPLSLSCTHVYWGQTKPTAQKKHTHIVSYVSKLRRISNCTPFLLLPPLLIPRMRAAPPPPCELHAAGHRVNKKIPVHKRAAHVQDLPTQHRSETMARATGLAQTDKPRRSARTDKTRRSTLAMNLQSQQHVIPYLPPPETIRTHYEYDRVKQTKKNATGLSGLRQRGHCPPYSGQVREESKTKRMRCGSIRQLPTVALKKYKTTYNILAYR